MAPHKCSERQNQIKYLLVLRLYHSEWDQESHSPQLQEEGRRVVVRIDTLPGKSLVTRPVPSSQPCPTFCSTPTSISTPGMILHTSLSVTMLSNWYHSLLPIQLAPWKVQGRTWFSVVGRSPCRSQEWTHMVLLTLPNLFLFFFFFLRNLPVCPGTTQSWDFMMVSLQKPNPLSQAWKETIHVNFDVLIFLFLLGGGGVPF